MNFWIKNEAKNEVTYRHRFLIDFWSIFGPFLEPKSLQNRFRSGFGRALDKDSVSKLKQERAGSIGPPKRDLPTVLHDDRGRSQCLVEPMTARTLLLSHEQLQVKLERFTVPTAITYADHIICVMHIIRTPKLDPFGLPGVFRRSSGRPYVDVWCRPAKWE